MQSPRPCWVGREQTIDSARVCALRQHEQDEIDHLMWIRWTAVAVEGTTQRGRTHEQQETHVV